MELHPGDGFTLVLDKYLHVLKNSKSTTPQFESVKRPTEEASSISSAPTLSSTSSSRPRSSDDPFAYTADPSLPKKDKAVTSNAVTHRAPKTTPSIVNLDDDDEGLKQPETEDEELERALQLSRMDTGGVKPVEEPQEDDEAMARRLQAEFDQEEARASKEAQKALQRPPSTTRLPLDRPKSSLFHSAVPGSKIGSTPSNRLSSPVNHSTSSQLSTLGRKVVSDSPESKLDPDSLYDMLETYSVPSTAQKTTSNDHSSGPLPSGSTLQRPPTSSSTRGSSTIHSAPIPKKTASNESSTRSDWGLSLPRQSAGSWQSKSTSLQDEAPKPPQGSKVMSGLPMVHRSADLKGTKASTADQASKSRLSQMLKEKPMAAPTAPKSNKKLPNFVAVDDLESETEEFEDDEAESILGKIDSPPPKKKPKFFR